MARNPKVEALPLFDAIAGLDNPPTEPGRPAGDDTAPVPLPEPTTPDTPRHARPERRRRGRLHARPPAAAIVVAAILTAAVTVGLLTRPGQPPPPTTRVAAATPPIPATPPPPTMRPPVKQHGRRRHAPIITHPKAEKPARTPPPTRVPRQVATRRHPTALRVGSPVGEFAP